ncbi:MAG: fibronectin type III domain-containing protein [Ignavibacteriales bacterium]|nr:fibronectin type III domain-containing protein [Ignavibacteriales bacterium]
MKKLLLLVIVVLLVLVCNSCKESNTEPEYTAKVEIIAPLDNQAVSDTFFVALGISNLQSITKIEYYVDDVLHGYHYTLLQTYPISASAYTDNTTHKIRAKVYDGTGNFYYSNIVTVTTYNFTPSGLSGFVENDSTLNLEWIDNSYIETGFEVYISSDDKTYNLAATTIANVPRCTIKGVFTVSDKWYVKVRGVKDKMFSSFAKATISTYEFKSPVITSYSFLADSSIEIRWTDNNYYEDSYKIELDGIYEETVSKNSTSILIKRKLPVNTQIYFRVGATRGSARKYSAFSSASISFQAPSALTVVQGTANGPKLQWKDESSIESGFIIERKSSVESQFFQLATVGSNSTSYTDNTVDTALTYTYRIEAFTAKGNFSYYSNELAVVFSSDFETESVVSITGIENSPAVLRNNKVFVATGRSFKEVDLQTGAFIRQFDSFSDTGFVNSYNPAVQSHGLFAASAHYRPLGGSVPSDMVCIWNGTKGQVFSKITSQYSMRPVGFLSDNNTIVLEYGNLFYLYNMTTLQKTATFTRPNMGKAVIDDQKDLIYTASSGLVRILSLKTGSVNSHSVMNVTEVLSCTVDGKYVVVRCNNTIKVLNVANYTVIHTFDASAAPIVAEFIPEMDVILYSESSTPMSYELSTGKKSMIKGLNGDLHYYCLRQNTMYAVTGSGVFRVRPVKNWMRL